MEHAEQHGEQEPDPPSSQDMPTPLAGVKFARMTGPGPFGFRQEHFAAMLKCMRRRAVNRLLRAISEAENFAANGTLPPEGWSWIMGSRLVYTREEDRLGTKTHQSGRDLATSYLQASPASP